MTLTLWGQEYEIKSVVSVVAGRAKSYRLWIEPPFGELVAIEKSREAALHELTEIVRILNEQENPKDSK